MESPYQTGTQVVDSSPRVYLKFAGRSKERGLTLVPLRLYFTDRGIAKCVMGLCKGKKLHDKRETIKRMTRNVKFKEQFTEKRKADKTWLGIFRICRRIEALYTKRTSFTQLRTPEDVRNHRSQKIVSRTSGNQISILDVPIFSMKAAEQVVLRGESGCGKTTLLHTISGLLDCDSGSIKLDGIELTKYSEAARDRIRADKLGYVFQTFNLLPAFTALENVKLGMTFAKDNSLGKGHRTVKPCWPKGSDALSA